MNKRFKSLIALVLALIIVPVSLPFGGLSEFGGIVANAAEQLVKVEDTNYGVLDTDIKAKKLTFGEDYLFTSHIIDYQYKTAEFGEGYAIMEHNELSGYYLVGIKGLVKSFNSSEEPELTLLKEHSQYFPYDIYKVKNPDTGKYDIYNANSGEYYEYGLDVVYNCVDPYDLYEYSRNVLMVQKDNKYGIINNKGKMIYTPAFNDIRAFKNCMVGYDEKEVQTEYGTIAEYYYTILSNDGRLSQNKAYRYFYYGEDYQVLAVSNGEHVAGLSAKTLRIITDFKYKYVKVNYVKDYMTYNGHTYRLVHYIEKYIESGEEKERTKFDIICDDGTVIDLSSEFNGLCYSATKLNEEAISISVKKSENNYMYYNISPDAKKTYWMGEKWQDMRDCAGYYNGIAYFDDYGDIWLADSSGTKIIENIGSDGVKRIGNYLLIRTYTNKESKYHLYDTINKKFVFENVYFKKSFDSNDTETYGAIYISQTENGGKSGIFDLNTGKFSGYVIDGKSNLSYTYLSEGKKLYKIGLNLDDWGNTDEYCYLNQDFKFINISNDYEISLIGSNILLKAKNEKEYGYVTYEENKIMNFDGKILATFNSYTEDERYDYYEEIPEAYQTLDYETENMGLINSDGRTILGQEVEYIGVTRNGLTYAQKDNYSSIIDKNGKALIYGIFENDCLTSWGRNPYAYVGNTSLISFRYNGDLYIYDLSKCNGDFGDVDSSVVTEDSLFGEYSAYLNNSFYNSMCGVLENDMANAVSKYGKNAKVLAYTKSVLNGNTGYIVGKLWDMLPFTSSTEAKLQQELALEYIEHLDTGAMNDILGDVASGLDLVDKINTVQDEIKSLNSEKEKLEFIQIWKSDLFKENQLYDVITVVGNNQYVFDRFLKETGRAVSVVEFMTTYLTICSIQNGIVQRLMQLIPKNTDLYKGLERINNQQKSGWHMTSVLVGDMLTDEGLSLVADLAEEGILKLFTGKYASLVSIVLTIICNMVGTMIDSADMEAVEKATFAMINSITLKKAVADYKTKITNNYENGGKISVEVLKTNYALLCGTYFRSLFAGAKYAKEILTKENDKSTVQHHIDQYDGKIIYRSYLLTCLLNARANWEYTVKANKAVISKLKAEYPQGEGRIPLTDLLKLSFSKVEFSNSRDSVEYTLDVPKQIDGYEVSAISTGTFENDDRVTGVYVSDTVKTIESDAFKGCRSLDTVYLGENVEQVEGNAFNGCENLGYVNIPDSASNIDYSAFTGFEDLMIESGDQNILDGFGEYETVTTNTREKDVAKIEISKQPTSKTVQLQGEINTSGLVVKVIYKDNTTKNITDGFYCEIIDRKLGANKVTVWYGGVYTEYNITVTAGQCSYTVRYEDEAGNEIADAVTGSALAGSTLKLDVKQIAGYEPENATQSEVIGYKNDFVVKYNKKTGIDISKAVITAADCNFNHKEHTPEVTVKLDGKVLKKDVDYSLKYGDNIYIGDAVIIVIGMGAYEGMAVGGFKIIEVSHSFTKYVYDNNATCTKDGTKTAQCDNLCGETKTITVEGTKLGHSYASYYTTDKYATMSANGSKSKHCIRSGCTAKKSSTTVYRIKSIELSNDEYTYNGERKIPTVVVKDSKGKVLKENTDYYFDIYSDSTSTGKHTALVEFIGLYSGYKYCYYTIAPSVTKKITATQTATTVKLSWSQVTGATGYRIYKYNTKTKKYETVKSETTKTSYTVKSLKSGTNYKFAVRAYTKAYDGTLILAKKYKSISTATKPVAPSLKVSSTSKGKASLSWSNVSGESGYQVYYSTKKSSGFKKLSTYKVNVTKGTKTKLTSKKTYYFKVRAYKKTDSGTVYSSYSSVKSVKIK